MISSFNLGDFIGQVADYLESEYDPDDYTNLTHDEKWTIRSMIENEYYKGQCVSNVTNKIIEYLKTNRNIISQ